MNESDAGNKINTNSETSFNAPEGAVVDAERLVIHNKANEYMKQNNCDYVEAVIAVS